jgi:hypothetical protein
MNMLIYNQRGKYRVDRNFLCNIFYILYLSLTCHLRQALIVSLFLLLVQKNSEKSDLLNVCILKLDSAYTAKF